MHRTDASVPTRLRRHHSVLRYEASDALGDARDRRAKQGPRDFGLVSDMSPHTASAGLAHQAAARLLPRLKKPSNTSKIGRMTNSGKA